SFNTISDLGFRVGSSEFRVHKTEITHDLQNQNKKPETRNQKPERRTLNSEPSPHILTTRPSSIARLAESTATAALRPTWTSTTAFLPSLIHETYDSSSR